MKYSSKCYIFIYDSILRIKILRIFKTKWFDRFTRKNDINDSILIEAIERAENGLIDADLGNGIIKQRIARIGQGKSRGYRSIIIIKRGEIAFFAFAFSKNEKDNLSQGEGEEFKNMAKHLLSITGSDLSEGLRKGYFLEIDKRDD